MTDRIGESSKDVIKHLIISQAACDGSPTTIQPGAVVKMADALEAAEGVLEDCPTPTVQRVMGWIDEALRGYYGENR